MSHRRTHSWILAAFCLWATSARAQLQTGDLFGTVSDESGKPLPGATVTLTGIGAPQTRTTDEGGGFRFVGLYPGEYALRSELSGFSSVEQSGIGIRIGAKVELSVTLNAALTETITITSDALQMNPREQSQGPTLSQVELDQIPTARDPWSLLRQAPGVLTDRINVGGNESGQQSAFYVGGATGSDNVFAVDGVNLTDMAAVGASATYFDFGAYEEVQLTTASTDVTIQTAGVTINQVTKRGSNDWRGDGRYLRTEGEWQAATKEKVGNKIDSVEEYGANFGGPLSKDHLWVWASYGESDIGILAAGTGQLDRTQLEDFNSKLNFQWGSNSGVLHYWTNDKIKKGRNAGPEFAPESTWDQTTPSDIWKLEDSHLFGSDFYVNAFYSEDDGAFTLSPQGGLSADVLLDENGVWQGSYWDFDQSALITQAKADASYFFDTGAWSHELRFGASYREQENSSISVLPGSRQAVLTCEGYGLVCADNVELVEWTRHNIDVTTKYEATWVQDTVSLERWTISAGLRYDKQTARNNPLFDPGNPAVPNGLFPAIDFKGNDAGNLDWKSIVPRVGVTYALGEQRKTLLRGTYSRYAAQLGQWVANQVSPTAPYSYIYFYFTDANQNLKFDPSEAYSLYYYGYYNVNLLDPSSSPNQNDPNLDPYQTDEVTLALQHAFPNNFGVSATLIYRNTTDLLEQRTLINDGGTIRAATRDDYVSDGGIIVAVLPDGRQVSVPTYSLRDVRLATGGTLLTNGDREIEYWGLIFGFEKPMANQWSVRGNFTWNDNKLRVGSESRHFDDPTDNIFAAGGGGDSNDIYVENGYGNKGLSAIHSRWSFNVIGVYQVAPDRPWGFNLAASFSGREGSPFIPSSERSFFGQQLTPKLDDFRFSDVYTVDARIEKDFTIGDLRLTASLDGFNLTNSQPVLQRRVIAPEDPVDLPDSYGVLERLSPRVFRWGVMFHFR